MKRPLQQPLHAVSREQKGRLWPYFTFHQILNWLHWCWVPTLKLLIVEIFCAGGRHLCFTISSFWASTSILRHCSPTQSHWGEAQCQSSGKINCKWRQHVCHTGVTHVSIVIVSISPKNTFNTFRVFTTCVKSVCTDMDVNCNLASWQTTVRWYL